MFTSLSEFREIAASLLSAQRNLALYPTGHPQVTKALEECYLHLRESLLREQQIPIVIAGPEFVVGDLQIPVEGVALEGLAGSLRQVGIEKLIFLQGMRQWEIRGFLRLLNMDGNNLEQLGGIEKVLEEEGIEHILAGLLHIEETDEPEPDPLVRAWEAYTSGLTAVRKLRHGYRTTGTLEHLQEAKDFVSELVEVGMQQTRPLLALQALKLHDEYSVTHSINVATLTLAMARGLNFGKYELREATLAALLHDIGKERIPTEVLRKPDKLDDEEWAKMQRHTLEGAKMLVRTPGVGDLAPIVAYEHHLGQNGEHDEDTSWPLHLVSETVMIADVYDALRSNRPYRVALPPDKVLEMMQDDTENQFNDDLLTGFARMVGYYPPGTCVRLMEGEIGVSCQNNPDDLRRPHVLLVRDRAGEPMDPAPRVDLSAGSRPDSIVEVVDPDDAGIDPLDYL